MSSRWFASTRWRCGRLELFPSAAEVVMGRLPRVAADAPVECRVPWLHDAGDAEEAADSG